MTTRLLRVIETVKAVRQDTRVWVDHLTGEGPATVRRQREAVARVVAAAPPVPSTRRTPASEKPNPRTGRTVTAAPGRQPALGIR
jgi:hypothetical protein